MRKHRTRGDTSGDDTAIRSADPLRSMEGAYHVIPIVEHGKASIFASSKLELLLCPFNCQTQLEQA